MILRWATSEADMGHCYAVRWEVFVDEQKVPEDLELDHYDATALHVLAMAGDGQPAGTSRMMTDTPSAGSAKIGRVAVRAAYRGQGIAAQMMHHLEEAARARGQKEIVLDAQLTVIPMYEKLGYTAHGEIFDDAGIDHRKMTKAL